MCWRKCLRVIWRIHIRHNMSFGHVYQNKLAFSMQNTRWPILGLSFYYSAIRKMSNWTSLWQNRPHLPMSIHFKVIWSLINLRGSRLKEEFSNRCLISLNHTLAFYYYCRCFGHLNNNYADISIAHHL